MERDQATQLIIVLERIATALERIAELAEPVHVKFEGDASQVNYYGRSIVDDLRDFMRGVTNSGWRDEEAKYEGESYTASQTKNAESPEFTED